MIYWINGSYGVGKTTIAECLVKESIYIFIKVISFLWVSKAYVETVCWKNTPFILNKTSQILTKKTTYIFRYYKANNDACRDGCFNDPQIRYQPKNSFIIKLWWN